MGYTHYFYTEGIYDEDLFSKVSCEFQKMVEPLKRIKVHLADGFGENYPIITPKEISFNGNRQCFHGEDESCHGDCSHETFRLEQQQESSDGMIGEFSNFTDDRGNRKRTPHNEVGKFFDCTKTARKPYDLAVQVCLIIAKNYLKDGIIIHSDGDIEEWGEAKEKCQYFLGYGEEFVLDV